MDVKTNDELREELLVKALESLKTQAKAVVDEVMGDLYCDYLPHIVTDTDSNIGNRVSGVVKNLIAGKFERCGDSAMVRVGDSYNFEHYISFSSWDAMVRPLCDLMGPEIVSVRIKQLEQEVESLNRQLRDAWRR